jgi:eukaryotic-like serine/threonine-protein kinase
MQRTLSHYTVEEEIGRGGMGVVYRAVDTRLGRAVAIKMLPAGATTDPERNRRFIQEARAASALNHSNIVTIYDIDEEGGATFIAMELVEGAPLDQVMSGAPLSVVTALDYGMQVAAALAAAHASGIIHRDIKPGNIMITRDGRVKVLDFGLAKLIERPPAEATMTALATHPGLIMGTAAYMSPEQAEGHPVDARSDIFSFGAVLYEMLTSKRAFAGNSDVGLITAILRDQPAPVHTVRSEVPAGVERIVERCLAKDPSARYPNAAAAGKELAAAHSDLTRPAEAAWRRPVVAIPLAVVLLALAALGGWQMLQSRRAREARLKSIPEIERLQSSARSLDAVRVARQIERYAPEDVDRIRRAWPLFSVETEPAGADVQIKNYADVGGAWEPLGHSPISNLHLPFVYYRFRVTKPGYVPIEFSGNPMRQRIRLETEEKTPAGMVRVAGGMYEYGVAAAVQLPDYWIDRYEVTNREFKKFVDAGGYRDPKYWTEPFHDGDRVLSFPEAIARFKDSTDRPGPATWDLGTFPEGQADFPVGGISWFEASAYAVFTGKSLPSLYHWYRAAGADQIYSDIITLSNFDGHGPARAGERQGVGPWGTWDMAGNVKEWCVNIAQGTSRRYILGGGWNEPNYRFTEADARNPWDRGPTFGVRLVQNLGPAAQTVIPVGRVNPDPKSVVPIPDAELDVYKRFYTYDRTPLAARTDAVDDRAPAWRKETISFAAAYGGERVPAYLFLPKNATPPYQTIVLFPSGYARSVASSETLDLAFFDFIVKSGRALLYPVYQGTFERRRGESSGLSELRDMQVQWAKDFFRAVDYLETRKDVDLTRLGYYSLSMGAYFAPVLLSQEPRIRTAVLVAGGLRYHLPPEIHPANFLPRTTIPLLLVNGRDDFGASVAAQERFMELLGTPSEHKRHVVVDGGHVPNDMRALIREVLNWYDKYLGAIK